MSNQNDNVGNGPSGVEKPNDGNSNPPVGSGSRITGQSFIFDPSQYRKDGGGNINGNDHASTSSAGEQRRKRGRPAGSGKTTAASDTVGASEVADLLVGIHAMLASITKVNEFAIEPEEAQRLAKAGIRLGELYDYKASAKAIAWTNFTAAIGAVYGTRIMAAVAIYKMRNATPEQPRPNASFHPASPQQQPSNRVEVPGAGPGGTTLVVENVPVQGA